jgi:predicted alpha/beta hydrolase family esterase
VPLSRPAILQANEQENQTETLVTFEYVSSSREQPHSILFVGGLGDGLATTSYTADLVRSLQPTQWSFFTLNLTSSYQAWGLGHLDRDTDEIAQCIRYIKSYKNAKFGHSKLVLMGHSTGSQCVMHYLSRPNPHTGVSLFDPDLQHIQRLAVDGAIMQAPVSDREAIQWVLQHGFGDKSQSEVRAVYKNLDTMAKKAALHNTSSDTMLPISMTCQIGYPPNTPLSCRRFLSLTSPESPESPSEDDLFSSDLAEAQLRKTFGMIKKRGLLKHKLMVLISGADQSVPDWINKEVLLSKWKNATNQNQSTGIWDGEHSGVIPGASHALSDDGQEESRKLLIEKVLSYLQTVELCS